MTRKERFNSLNSRIQKKRKPASNTVPHRVGEKSSDIRVGMGKDGPALFVNFGGKTYSVALNLVGVERKPQDIRVDNIKTNSIKASGDILSNKRVVTNTIAENTSANGVVIDGTKLKDKEIGADASLTAIRFDVANAPTLVEDEGVVYFGEDDETTPNAVFALGYKNDAEENRWKSINVSTGTGTTYGHDGEGNVDNTSPDGGASGGSGGGAKTGGGGGTP